MVCSLDVRTSQPTTGRSHLRETSGTESHKSALSSTDLLMAGGCVRTSDLESGLDFVELILGVQPTDRDGAGSTPRPVRSLLMGGEMPADTAALLEAMGHLTALVDNDLWMRQLNQEQRCQVDRLTARCAEILELRRTYAELTKDEPDDRRRSQEEVDAILRLRASERAK